MKEKALIIIPSSERKRGGEVSGLSWERKTSAAGGLSAKSAERLMESRRALQKRFRFQEGKDLGGRPGKPVPLMPSRLRYDGNLYRKIDDGLWTRMEKKDGIDLLIVSSLYGLLTPREAVRAYDMPMNRAVRMGVPLKKWWVNRGILSLIAEFIKKNDYSIVHDFLGGSFIQLADFQASEPLLAFGKKIRLVRHAYPGLGSGADHHRGRDVRELLEKYLS
ncbi:MAG: peroxide stress protein YaaA [Deltaproteobacteria bacterium]|nr:peroxide stress protein YaaA [Deltaproteobacteria bacterium]NIS76874.1 peroxide stress protein YaaA [Deltaproteobacteria bacterium]